MAKGENIFKRKDGRWEARYIKGYELSGKSNQVQSSSGQWEACSERKFPPSFFFLLR